MPHHKLRTSFAVILVIVLCFVGLDKTRHRCEQLLPRLVDHSAAAMGLVSRPFLGIPASENDPDLTLYRMPSPLQLRSPGFRAPERWRSVQSGEFAVHPQLNFAVVAPSPGFQSPGEYLEEFEALNPSASRIDPGERVLPSFLMLQIGGGVEGLLLQSVLFENGDCWVWRGVGPWDEADMEDATRVSVPIWQVERFFRFARAAGLPSIRKTEYCCGVLDGGVKSLTMLDAGVVGRVRFLNSRPAERTFGWLMDSLEGFAVGVSLKKNETNAARPELLSKTKTQT